MLCCDHKYLIILIQNRIAGHDLDFIALLPPDTGYHILPVFEKSAEFHHLPSEKCGILHDKRYGSRFTVMHIVLRFQLFCLFLKTDMKNVADKQHGKDNTDNPQRISNSISQRDRFIRCTRHIGKSLLGRT